MDNVERQYWANAQHWRREFLEVVGIPSSVNIKDLESKVWTVFNRISAAFKPDHIEAYHGLYNDLKKQLSHFQKVKFLNKFCE